MFVHGLYDARTDHGVRALEAVIGARQVGDKQCSLSERDLAIRDWLRLRHCLSRQWETYRAKRISRAHLAVLDDRPSVTTDRLQLGRCRHSRQLCVRVGPPFRYDDTGASLSASIATLWNGGCSAQIGPSSPSGQYPKLSPGPS